MLPGSSYSLLPYQKKLSQQDLLHLLRRTLMGVGHKELQFFKNKSLQQCLDVLLKQSPTPPPPVQADPDVTDPLVPNGEIWVNMPCQNEQIERSRKTSLRAWWTGLLINRDFSITEKMTLFWHNHFVTEMDVVCFSQYSYRYLQLLHRHSLGNFKQFILEGTTDCAMLVYLNGNTNTKQAPNENYGRELFELFTLGKTPDVHYTEDDVKAAARVLSGWTDNRETISAVFDAEKHDTGDKTFSAYFNHYTIKGRTDGEAELRDLIDMIFRKKEAAKFVCRNLYRWLVTTHVNEETEEKIIAPLADILIQNNYEIVAVLRTLLGSEHFFDTLFRGCIVKSPVDFYIGALQQFNLAFPLDFSRTNLCWIHIYFNIGGLSMTIGDPPSVAGWPAYYQPPKYHQWWLNSYTLAFRNKTTDDLHSPEGTNCNGPRIKFNFSDFAKHFKNPADVDQLTEDSVALLLATPISEKIKALLKAELLSGQKTNYYWTEAWNKLQQQPDNAEYREVVESRLKRFFGRIMNLPEFQLM